MTDKQGARLTEGGSLRTLSLGRLRDAVLAGDPGCVCDPELFTGPAGFEEDEEPPEEQAARIAVAREVCASCPVRLPCLAYALRLRPAAGVWAGFTAEQIRDLSAAAARPVRSRGRHAPLRDSTSAPFAVGGAA